MWQKNRNSFLVLVIFVNSICAQDNELTLSINLTQDAYIEGESVYVIMNLKNNSSRDIIYSCFRLQCGGLRLNVFHRDGRDVPYSGAKEDFGQSGPEQYVLKAHDQVSYGIVVEAYYPTFIGDLPFYRRMAPDKYSVRAQYLLNDFIIESNELSFQVDPAIGKDKDALIELEKLHVSENFLKDNYKSSISKFEEYLRKYGKSLYAPLVMDKIAMIYHFLGNVAKEKEIQKALIKKYPDNSYALQVLDMKILSTNEKLELYQDVLFESPNSAIAKYGRKIIGIKEISNETK